MSLILASASPRRRDILRLMGFEDFIVRPAPDCEPVCGSGTPEQTVCSLSRWKAETVYALCQSEDTVIAADTLVFLDGQALGKPRSDAEAVDMLRRLSGRCHQVLSGVTVVQNGRFLTDFQRTLVHFRPLDDDEILSYVATGESADKAGAYGVQGRGCVFVQAIEGDYFNVMGLPACKLHQMLTASGQQA